MRWAFCGMLLGACCWAMGSIAFAAETLRESAREIPVAEEVDVLVVGGGTGAVSAAVAAANGGARVFLAAPYAYLGDDITATLRLSLEKGETPRSQLARLLYADSQPEGPDPNRLPFTYEADVPSAKAHRDTTPPSLLKNGQWASASTQSVQYDGNTSIIADLAKAEDVRRVRLMFYRRAGSNGFDIQRVTVSVSNDKQSWREATVINNDQPLEEVATLSARVEVKPRYVRFDVEKPASVSRLLLGEIEIIGAERTASASQTAASPPPRPMHVKRALDDALLGANVKFLYGCYCTDVLHDANGKLSGVVMANRAGRQAVIAKTVLDATPRSSLARLAGAKFTPYPGGEHTFQRVVIGGEPRQGDRVVCRTLSPGFPSREGPCPIFEYTLTVPVADDSYASHMRADQLARSLTYHPDQQFTSDALFEVPPDFMQGRETASGEWEGVDRLPLGAFQPAGVERIGVLGGCADVARPLAERLLRPLAQIELGERMGQWAAATARKLPAPTSVRLTGSASGTASVAGSVRELLTGARPTQTYATIPQEPRDVPVLGTYDVVVIGGGTGGAPAGIGAARQGAKTLVVESLHGLGGVGTLGAIASYYWGNRVGFTRTVLEGQAKWPIEPKMEWYRTELLKAGAEIWFGTIGCGAVVQDHRVRGVVVATPAGRGVVLAQTVIDATGNSDVAAAAGAETIYTDASEFGMQGTGLPGRRLHETYNNTDFTIVDETDMLDMWHMLVYSKDKYPQAFDQGRLIDTRERRRIVGDFVITLADQINERTYPDTVVRCWSNFDSHGYTVDPLLLLEHPEKKGIGVNVPFRAMLPQSIEGILVIGLGISAHRDAVPLIRMQPDIQNGGYAAGVAAAMAAAERRPVRSIDIKQLQKHLVAIGNLPETVLTDRDAYPLPDSKIAEAVAELKNGKGAAVIMTHADRARPLLESAFDKSQGADRLAYAKALAVLGNGRGLTTLLEELKRTTAWDEGWNYRGMGQFGGALSSLDTLIVAIGHVRDPKAVPLIAEKASMLTADEAFSHHRAVGLALELIADPRGAPVLAELLQKRGMTGHAHDAIAVARQRESPGDINSVTTRRESLRELMLARALYRCGDDRRLGEKILRQYSLDLRGHLARHAQAVLREGPTASGEKQGKRG